MKELSAFIICSSHVWRGLCALRNVFGFRFAKRMKIIKIYDVRRSQ